MKTKRVPQRTCVVCREKKDKRNLARIVGTDNGLRIDPSGKLNGRGAYLCNKSACWDRAIMFPVLAKALRINLSDDDRMYLRQIKPA